MDLASALYDICAYQPWLGAAYGMQDVRTHTFVARPIATFLRHRAHNGSHLAKSRKQQPEQFRPTSTTPIFTPGMRIRIQGYELSGLILRKRELVVQHITPVRFARA
jgi:hypothetical protein